MRNPSPNDTTIFGLTLNHTASIDRGGIKYANFFCALIGPTGNARKDTAGKKGRDIINRLHSGDDDSSAGNTLTRYFTDYIILNGNVITRYKGNNVCKKALAKDVDRVAS